VGAIIISNGQALSEASKFKLCYAICCLVWALAGFIFGQIRTLRRFTILANLAVFINLAIIFVTMAGAADYPPRYSSVGNSAGSTIYPNLVSQVQQGIYPPVKQSGGLPTTNFAASLNGAMQAVYSFGGSMIFPEFMAELRRPRDFLKGMWGAQLFIYLWYMFYGLFMYGYQGQYLQSPSYLGISNYAFSTAGNSLAIVSALIAATLYGNIGVKGKGDIQDLLFNEICYLTLVTQSSIITFSSISLGRLHFGLNRARNSGSQSYLFIGRLLTLLELLFRTLWGLRVSWLPRASSISPTRFLLCSILATRL